jgi:eukaryotic-like serine/threonine-protein kinase
MNDLRERLQSSLGSAYTLDRELGGGGMSRVFAAQETALGRNVVVKVLPPELSAAVSTERFKREIAVAARLQHPHIVPLLSAGEMDGVPYFTMPFVEGESLRTRLARRGELPVSESVRILREIASGLAYAHQHGVVHRDIKPDNVLFSGDVAMVADFGVAKALSASSNGDHGAVTSLGVALGTPAYMAPEQATADPTTDHRADVYAFGVLAYEMLTGQPPFIGRNPSQLLAAHVTEVPEPVARRRPNLPPALAALVMHCLEKRPADRPQTAAEIVHTLDAITTPSGGTAPTSATLRAASAPEASPGEQRAPRQAKRAGLIVLGIAALVLLAGGLAVWRNSAGSSSATTAADTRSRRIAVLPFENVGDSSAAYFADGMTDAVRGKLTGLAAMEVIARSSSIQYRATTKAPADIAKELGVRYLLTGTVRWAKDANGTSHVQVSPELVEVSADGRAASRWQQPFDAPLADVFRVQGEIAEKVASAMQVALGGTDEARLVEVPTRQPAAYDAYLRGEAIFLNGDMLPATLRRALAEYERAVQLDSTFVDAWARISVVLNNLYSNGTPDPRIAKRSRDAVARVARLDPNTAGTRRLQAHYILVVERNAPRALAELTAARAMAPGDASIHKPLAGAYIALGRFDDAVNSAELVQRLDPRSVGPMAQLAMIYRFLRRYPEGRSVTDRQLLLVPNVSNVQDRAIVALGEGDLVAARRLLLEWEQRLGRDELLTYFATYWDLGWVPDDAGQQRLLTLGPDRFDNDRAVWALVRAQVYGWRGDSAQSKVWGDTAAREFRAQVRANPDDAQRHVVYGLALAYAGQKAEAIAEGERGAALGPVEEDYAQGMYLRHQLARIYILTGEHAKALDILEELLAKPYYLSPGWLRIDPTFLPLKNNPRFEKLAAGG